MTHANRWLFHLSGAAALLATSACTAPVSLGNDDLTGTWNGHIENLQFKSGSDQVTFTITATQGSSVTGTVLFGDGTLLPPATNPNDIYPPGGVTLFDSNSVNEVEGFRYTMMDTDFTNTRLQLTLDLLQLWGGWCALQKPVKNPTPNHSGWWCGPAQEGSGGTVAQQNCMTLCQCSATACTSADQAPISFDLVVEGTQLQGSVTGLEGNGDMRNVVLTHQP